MSASPTITRPGPGLLPADARPLLAGRYGGEPLRVLVIPGLCDSGPGHWQTWLQGQYRDALRVQQADWHTPDLRRWAGRIGQVLARHPRTAWIAVAHSFGCLALARHLLEQPAVPDGPGLRAALLVAPAEPAKFGVEALLPQHGLRLPSTLVGSRTDPWMTLERARLWAERWGSRFVDLGEAGHINVESGHGPWPYGRLLVDRLIRQERARRRLMRAHPMELSYAV